MPAVAAGPFARISPFGTAQAATLNPPLPVSTAMPASLSYALAGLDTSQADMIGAIRDRLFGEPASEPAATAVPVTQRRSKGDRLAPAQRVADAADAAVANPAIDRPDRAEVVADATPAQEPGQKSDRLAVGDEHAAAMAHVYFGGEPISETPEPVRPWPAGEQPRVETVVVAVPAAAAPAGSAAASQQPRPAASAAAGETIASKGEVTGEGRRPMTPAEQLGLNAGNRASQETCLARAVYFEARSEPVRGQIGVAQVVLNRVFSGYYPSNICGVVYQNANRYLGCQFTFACDRHPDVIRDQEAWHRARAIAAGALDGKLWLPEIGKATHYHATYVRPYWVRNMQRLHRVGLHVFYRPRRWGDGADAPAWGDAAATAAATKAL